MNSRRKSLIAVGATLKLPIYRADRTAMFRHAATLVDKLLRGTKPANLSSEQPTKFELIANMKTAIALPLTLAQTVFVRANR